MRFFLRIKKYFIIENYISRIKNLKRRVTIEKVKRLKFSSCNISRVWEINKDVNKNFNFDPNGYYSIFGIKIKLENIEWHKDYLSGFSYPLEKFDRIKAIRYASIGADMKFPWEVSRFYFGTGFSFISSSNKKEIYYKQLRMLILDWIEKNPFLYGINWYSAMDVAIRAVNWIISLNFFWDLFCADNELKEKVSVSLSQHAEYICSFPLKEKKLTTNHTVSEYAGLLFIALSLREHPKSDKWINKAVQGLEECMTDQIYPDGVDFEGSIPYHRLVLEIFVYSTIIGISNGNSFSNVYYSKLFKMLEYTAAYIDEKGNAPQIGDNDSGRFLIFNTNNNPYSVESDHSYLLSLGENIFDYKFKSQCQRRDNNLALFLPEINKVKIDKIKIVPRMTDKSIAFKDGGAYILKNKNMSLLVPCFPIGQNGKGGHNNLDTGSFALSIYGKQVIVDPGTATYTRDKIVRDRFRSYDYHNTLYTKEDSSINWNTHSHWGLDNYYNHRINKFSENHLSLDIFFIKDKKSRTREFIIEENSLLLKDSYEGLFYSRINLNPELKVVTSNENKIVTSEFELLFMNSNGYELLNYDYSPFYDYVVNSKFIKISANKYLEIKLFF